jgi:predicted DCC family thiol-disulfide oxidoreductase YuxK
MGRIRFLLVLMCVSAGLWIAFAKLVVPPVIESAYRGQSLPFLNGLIKGQYWNPVGHYLQVWDSISTRVLLICLALWLLAMLMSSRAFFRRFVGEATPGTLGAIRMWVCAILLLTMMIEDFPSIALLPSEMRQFTGVMPYFYAFPGFEKFLTSEGSLRAFQMLTELVLFLGAIGLWTRIVIPLGAFCVFMMLGLLIDYSFFWHQNLVPLYVMAVLSFTPCGNGWSVDRLLRVYQGRSVPDANRAGPVYSWSRYICWAVIALAYVENGVAKLRDGGLSWWNSTNMRSILYFDTLTPREFDWAFSLYLAPAPDFLFTLLGIAALLAELSYGMVLFSRTARRILPVMAIMMHITILVLQRILFVDLILLQFIFLDWTSIRKKVGQRLALARGQIHILYDGFCPLCLRTVRLLACLDLFNRIEFRDFRQLDLADYNSSHALNLKPGDLEKEMYVVLRDRVYRGFYGYRAIALALPAVWPIAPWLFLPGISSLGALAYDYIARSRMKLLLCDSHCPVEPSRASGWDTVSARNDTGRWLGYTVALSGITIVSLLCWLYRVEFYPFTSWHLYTWPDNSGKVTYLKVFARYESGATLRARLEEAIGALAFDARYSRVIEKCFGQETEIEICKKFLTAAGSAYNKKIPPGERVTHYQIQKWTWDFRSSPSDPKFGHFVDRFIHEIKANGDLRVKGTS